MIWSFNDVCYIMNWAKFNDAKIIQIRALRIEMCLIAILTNSIFWTCCDELRCSTSFRTFSFCACNVYAIIAFIVQLIIITYVTKFQSRKLYYELNEIQRCKNYSNSIIEHWVMLRWSFNRLNFVNLRSQNKDAKRCRAFQLIAKFIELNLYKRSKHHSSMRCSEIEWRF